MEEKNMDFPVSPLWDLVENSPKTFLLSLVVVWSQSPLFELVSTNSQPLGGQSGVALTPRSRHSDLKGGRMIVLRNTNLPLSTDFSMEKKTPIFQNADFWGLN